MKDIKNNRVFYKLISSTEEYNNYLISKGQKENTDSNTQTEKELIQRYYVSEIFCLIEDVAISFDFCMSKINSNSHEIILEFRRVLNYLRSYIEPEDLVSVTSYEHANFCIRKLRDYVKKFYLGLGMDTSKFTPPPINPSNIIDNQR